MKTLGFAVSHHCYMADSMFILIENIDYAILRGLDYENKWMLRYLMSLNFVPGCSSNLRLEAGSNALYLPFVQYNSVMFEG